MWTLVTLLELTPTFTPGPCGPRTLISIQSCYEESGMSMDELSDGVHELGVVGLIGLAKAHENH